MGGCGFNGRIGDPYLHQKFNLPTIITSIYRYMQSCQRITSIYRYMQSCQRMHTIIYYLELHRLFFPRHDLFDQLLAKYCIASSPGDKFRCLFVSFAREREGLRAIPFRRQFRICSTQSFFHDSVTNAFVQLLARLQQCLRFTVKPTPFLV